MQNILWQTTPLKHQQIIQDFIKPYTEDTNTVCILLVWSYALWTAHKNSDLDIYIIVKDSETRTRVNTWKEWIEIEYFINPVNQVRYYLHNDENRATAHMLSTWIILYSSSETTTELISLAKAKLQEPVILTTEKKDNLIYSLDDIKKDINDVKNLSDKTTYHYMYNSILQKCTQYFFAIRETTPEKEKRIAQQMERLDPDFFSLRSYCVMKIDHERLLEIISTLEKQLWWGRKPERVVSGPLKFG